MKVVLLALTGFGNPVLEALLMDPRVQMEAVFSVKYESPFPYYQEEQLPALCARRSVPCYCDVKLRSDKGMTLLHHHAPDLIIIATFKQILTKAVLGLPTLGTVNLHPSLLPRYRGPCPTHAALLNDEQVTGVTAHYVVEQLDEGNLLLQRTIAIDGKWHDGQLRQQLARLAGIMIPDLIDMFADFARPIGTPQNHKEATYAPRPAPEDGYLELALDIPIIRRKVRALNPLPGTSILIHGQRIAVASFELFADNRADGMYEQDASVDVVVDRQAIRLFKKAVDM